MCTPPPHFCLTVPQFSEEGCWERGGDLFQGGRQFLHKKLGGLRKKGGLEQFADLRGGWA